MILNVFFRFHWILDFWGHLRFWRVLNGFIEVLIIFLDQNGFKFRFLMSKNSNLDFSRGVVCPPVKKKNKE